MILLQATTIDWTEVISAAVQTSVSLGLIAWVYKVMKAMNDDLKDQVSTLKKDVESLKASENKWFKKYHKLGLIIARNRCQGKDCKIHEAYQEYLSKEGEAI